MCEIDLTSSAEDQTLDLKLATDSELVTQLESVQDRQGWHNLNILKDFFNRLQIELAPFDVT